MKPQTLLISTFPPKNSTYGKGVSGAAHYVKSLIEKIEDYQFIVLSQKTESTESYKGSNYTVVPCWSQNSLFYFAQLIRAIVKRRDVKSVIINFEFKIFGGKSQFISVLNLLTFPIVLIILKLLRIKTFVILHPGMLKYKEMLQLSDHLHKSRFNPLLFIRAE